MLPFDARDAAFLSKPVPNEKLTNAIRRALARYEEAREQRGKLHALRARLANPRRESEKSSAWSFGGSSTSRLPSSWVPQSGLSRPTVTP